MNEPLYTLEQAKAEIARRTCQAIDHDWEIVQGHAGPIALLCTRCSKTLAVRGEQPFVKEPAGQDEPADSDWQTPTGQLDQAIRQGLRDAGVKGMLAQMVGPILCAVQAELDRQKGDIDYERDWAGECRVDPADGNAYVLRAIDSRIPIDSRLRYGVIVNDIFGGHVRTVAIDAWLSWAKESSDG